jgi:hypothetical protein
VVAERPTARSGRGQACERRCICRSSRCNSASARSVLQAGRAAFARRASRIAIVATPATVWRSTCAGQRRMHHR